MVLPYFFKSEYEELREFIEGCKYYGKCKISGVGDAN